MRTTAHSSPNALLRPNKPIDFINASSKRPPDADISASPLSKKLKYDTQGTDGDSYRDSTNDTNDPEEEEVGNEDASDDDKAAPRETVPSATCGRQSFAMNATSFSDDEVKILFAVALGAFRLLLWRSN